MIRIEYLDVLRAACPTLNYRLLEELLSGRKEIVFHDKRQSGVTRTLAAYAIAAATLIPDSKVLFFTMNYAVYCHTQAIIRSFGRLQERSYPLDNLHLFSQPREDRFCGHRASLVVFDNYTRYDKGAAELRMIGFPTVLDEQGQVVFAETYD